LARQQTGNAIGARNELHWRQPFILVEGSSAEENDMYIGGGALLVIVIILLVYFL
jgi:hypothetical protein